MEHHKKTAPSDPLPDLSPDIQVLRLADRDAAPGNRLG